jgi:hypothetical protein
MMSGGKSAAWAAPASARMTAAEAPAATPEIQPIRFGRRDLDALLVLSCVVMAGPPMYSH